MAWLDSPWANPYAWPVPEKMPRRKLYLLAALIAVISVFFLRDSYWQSALSEREFVVLYVEVVKLQTRWAGQPVKARTETRKFLEREGVGEGQLETFMQEVNKKPERWAQIWEKINKELEKDSIPPKNR